jgi:hypothetical protein
MATLLKVLNNLADIKSAGVLHFASELRLGCKFVASKAGVEVSAVSEAIMAEHDESIER